LLHFTAPNSHLDLAKYLTTHIIDAKFKKPINIYIAYLTICRGDLMASMQDKLDNESTSSSILNSKSNTP
jgi:hypothetical protein